ncbi:MAG: ATP-binding protein [Polyangiaceae bacterium]
MITLSVPGALEFRDVAVRVVGSACKLMGPSRTERPPGAEVTGRPSGDLDEFGSQVVSAFSEAFNNLALHGYAGVPRGRIEIEVTTRLEETGLELFIVRLTDTGHVFDPAGYLDMPEELPERGMGLFIMRSFLDEIRYQGGPPNVLTLIKRFRRASEITAP